MQLLECLSSGVKPWVPVPALKKLFAVVRARHPNS